MPGRSQLDRAPRPVLYGLIVSTLGLLVVTALVVTTGQLFGLDAAGVAFFTRAGQTGALHALLVMVTTTASAQVGLALLAVLGIGAGLHRRSLAPLVLTSAVAVALIASVYGLKTVVGRARPGLAAVSDPEPGFPSGHSTTAVVVAGMALVLLGPSLSSTRRRLAVALLVTYVAVVGLSRLYLQLHWFSDVLAGWLLGSAIVFGAAVVSARERPREPVRPEVAAGEGAGALS